MIELGNLKLASEICLCGFVELPNTFREKKKCPTVNIPILKQTLEMPLGLFPPH